LEFIIRNKLIFVWVMIIMKELSKDLWN